MTIPLTMESIHSFLDSKNYKPQLQKETNQVYLLFNFSGRDFPLFFRIFEGGDLLQMLAFIPCTLKKDAAAETGRLLHYLNKELDIPGFGMDEKVGLVFYRIMLPTTDKEVNTHIIEALLSSTRTICQTFAPAIATVAAGASTLDEVLAKVQQAQQKKP